MYVVRELEGFLFLGVLICSQERQNCIVQLRKLVLLRSELPLVFRPIRMNGRRCNDIAALATHVHSVKQAGAVLDVGAGVMIIKVIAAAPGDGHKRLRKGSVRPLPVFHAPDPVEPAVLIVVFVDDNELRHGACGDTD